MATASKATSEQSSGIIKARQKNILQGWQAANEITPGPRIRKILMRNEGANPIKVRFNNDAPGNFYTLTVGGEPITIEIVPETLIKTAGQGGDSVLQCIIWG